MSVPCKRCGFDFANSVHKKPEQCKNCQAPLDHHVYDPEVIVLTRWDIADLEKGRIVEVGINYVRKQTQEEEDAESR